MRGKLLMHAQRSFKALSIFLCETGLHARLWSVSCAVKTASRSAHLRMGRVH